MSARNSRDANTLQPEDLSHGALFSTSGLKISRRMLGLVAAFSISGRDVLCASTPVTSTLIAEVGDTVANDPIFTGLDRLHQAFEMVKSFPYPRRTLNEEKESELEWRLVHQAEFDALCDLCIVEPETIEGAAALSSAVVAYHRNAGFMRDHREYLFNALAGISTFLTAYHVSK